MGESLNLLEEMLGSDIQIHSLLPPDLHLTRADPTQIDQVLMNLFVNARDAMPNGGRLTVETRNLEFDEEICRQHPAASPGHYVMLSVSDTGIGMDAATLDRIFEPFFTTKGAGRGTGLGLATVYGIVKQHAGFVRVESKLAQGTTFRIYFPASLRAPGDVPQPGAGHPSRGGKRAALLTGKNTGPR